MSEMLSNSSDSDTIILGPNEYFDDDVSVATLVKKYISESETPSTSPKKFDFIEEDLTPPSTKRLKKNSENCLLSSDASTSQGKANNGNEYLKFLYQKYNKSETSDDLSEKTERKQKNLNKEKTLEEKKQKIKEIEQEKNLKKILATTNKNCKPSECMKFITVQIDSSIIEENYGSDMIKTLETADVKYKIQSNIVPHTITWTRKIESYLFNDNTELVLTSKEEETDHVLLVMNCEEILDLISNKTLSTRIQCVKSLYINKKVTLIIQGLQDYKRFLKNQHQKEIRNHLTKGTIPNNRRVSNEQIEFGLTELQLLCSCSHRLVDSPEEFALLVSQFTKAVAEIPFKLQRNEKFQQTNWFVAGVNRNTVKVDKNGNGLRQLWDQMLTMFPLARLETANAISAKYPTIPSLLAAYENCTSGSELLQDIPIRRAAGPLSSTRKIGPELSKKIHKFLTSLDGDILL